MGVELAGYTIDLERESFSDIITVCLYEGRDGIYAVSVK